MKNPKRKKLTKKQLQALLDDLEKNPNDRVRILGEIGIVALGAVGAGAVVAAAGVPVAVVPIIGFVILGPAPIGWVAAAAAAGGAVFFGAAKLISNGARLEGMKRELLETLRQRMRDFENKEGASKITQKDKTDFYVLLKLPLTLELITTEQAQDLMDAVENGHMSLLKAYALIWDILNQGWYSNPRLPPGK